MMACWDSVPPVSTGHFRHVDAYSALHRIECGPDYFYMSTHIHRYGPRAAAGFSLIEVMATVALLGLLAMLVLHGVSSRATRLAAAEAARTFKYAVQRARMDAIYTGVNKFVVIDTANRSIEIFADLGTTNGQFDAADPRVFSEHWGEGTQLAFPAGTTSITDPLGGSDFTSAWSMPAPDSSAAWGTNRIGFTLTPRGIVESATSTPTTINAGSVVFSNRHDRVSAVILRGRLGTVDSFEMLNGNWRRL